MDWQNPLLMLLTMPALLALWWFQRASLHPMSQKRRRALLVVRALLVALMLVAIARPAWQQVTDEQAVIFVLDHSASQGESGIRVAYARAQALAAALPSDAQVGYVSAGQSARVLRVPSLDREPLEPDLSLMEEDGSQTDLEAAVLLARGIFPPDVARRIVLVGDGLETRGDLEEAARDAAVARVVIDAVPIAGQPRPDARVVRLRGSRSQLHEGASLELYADVESSLAGEGRIRLFENGIQVESRPLELKVGEKKTVIFQRSPDTRGAYTYRARIDGFADDELADNDEALALADVRGQPLLLYIEGEPDEAHYLAEAMASEGIRLQVRPPSGLPDSLAALAGYDGVILSDLPAHDLSEKQMTLIRDYIEQLGGGFLMIGGARSFGVGGYYRTPIEDILPVKMKAPDTQLQHSTALALVVDRSSSMQGQKIEMCKSACTATVDLLTRKDYLAVVAFDSAAHWIVPMAQLTSPATANSQISGITSAGGTNLQPAMTEGYHALQSVKARLKHMIILTDGQTAGGGYEALATQMHQEGMTVSTVAVGAGADVGLCQRIAAAGAGQAYVTTDPANIPKIFTQDTMVHIGKLVREESFVPRQVERHPMLRGFATGEMPPLLGYVKTHRRSLSQVPLVTDQGDPLLAHWRFGLGKVTAFTSDCKSRWSASWITGWSGYSRFWAQVLREMARSSQGQGIDLRLAETHGRQAAITVDLAEETGEFKNDAEVTADVYFVPAGASQTALRELHSFTLDQTAPGRYERGFPTTEPGVYLVRARSGSSVVSGGLVSNLSGEVATGQVNEALLARVATTTSGRLLVNSDLALPPLASRQARYLELAPPLLRLILLLFLFDIIIRRWENLLGVWELVPKSARKPNG
jgi:uncharacterized membrane protein